MPLRVIAGEAGGRILKGPRPGIRPTSDRVREAIFEIVVAHGGTLGKVLDLYSGTGAMGIEALSRGAKHCDFVEADAKSCEIIRENLSLTGLKERAKVFNLPVARALARLERPYDLVVADPPYEYDRAETELRDAVERGLLAEDGVVVVEHSKRRPWPDELSGRSLLVSRRYGDTSVTIYR
jgi:16S rRNA (guanine(966)-N(2))-methyltransferase RsmD